MGKGQLFEAIVKAAKADAKVEFSATEHDLYVCVKKVAMDRSFEDVHLIPFKEMEYGYPEAQVAFELNRMMSGIEETMHDARASGAV